jgi:histidyl-tRNA synthetase
MQLPYQIDHRMVRGLDYYTRTVFEVQPVDGGGQSTICGGGRYDGLITELGGRETPGIGFATGLERLTLNLKRSEVAVPDEPSPLYLVANVGDDARIAALELSVRLRRAGVGAILSSGSRGLRGQMRQANALNIPFTLILGDDEIEKGEVVVRNMETSEQESKPLAEFLKEVTGSQA